ncbi:MAG: DUF4962 domain-containing protein [Bacteroidales bacterium]
MKKYLLICFSLGSLLAQAQSTYSSSGAEITLQQEQLIPTYINIPQPQGLVDENSPWLHVNIPLYEESDINSVRKAKIARLKFKRRFYFKLSKDPSFQKDVFESGPKRWSFYNPYEHLSKGKWFWKYGVADPETPDKPIWHNETFSFQITGNERITPIPPKPEELVNIVISRPAPTFQLFREEFGNLLPTETWPEMANWGYTYYERKYNDNMSMSYTISDKDAIDAGYVDGNGVPNAQLIFYRKLLNNGITLRKRYINDLVAGYLLLGDRKFLDRAITKSRELWNFFNSGSSYIASLGVNLVVKDEVWDRPYELKNFIDISPDVLTEAEKKEIIDEVYPSTWSYPQDSEYAEHIVYEQHMWQEFMEKLKTPLIFARYKEEAREELKYAYELWLYRAPALSRTDGGSLEGDGYLGVHDSYLATIPWLLYKLTGYNYFKAHPWFANHGKYLTYINPFGNAGNPFCDGDTGGATMPYLMEMMAYMVPENYWNLWRFRTIGRSGYKNFTADLGKKDIALALLSLWTHVSPPDTTAMTPPAELASHFQDIGEVGMHTDLGNEKNNLHVVMHASPYGSGQHLHPAQNAFNVAYGGQDLFWKTGFYNGGDWHNQLSYKNSRAHNTIMANGMSQGFHKSSYGWMPRFVHGEQISYALGDASKAYNDQNNYKSDKYKDENGNFLLAQTVPYLPEYGFGNPGVTKFRRHLSMLRPNIIVIYDELEAKEPITWEFRLHSRRYMKKINEQWFLGKNDHAAASARLFCISPTETQLYSEYLKNEREPGYIKPAPQDAWRMRPVDDENKLPKPIPEHYHGVIKTKGAHTKMRFLTVIQIFPGENENYKPVDFKSEGTDLISVKAGEYTIQAQLNGEQPSFLEITNSDNTAGLISGTGAEKLKVGEVVHTAKVPGSTLLFEQNKKGEIFKEVTDSLPDVLIYGNTY